ncbi:cyclic pyranopterin monophosphate synthase MoaC [Lentzea sp. NEAU-D7]|nr:cyclic pyranopterin monophosphate synthase MoaC [Lentzea sp. NEAU-D7]
MSHVDALGRARMVDVSPKEVTRRIAVASGIVLMQPETADLVVRGHIPKGDVLATARLAGMMAAKKTADLVPLCHPLPLSHVEIDIVRAGPRRFRITATTAVHARTGVEMEALVAVSAAGLTVYDMCKAVDRGMVITDIRLEHKRGGRSGEFSRPADETCPSCGNAVRPGWEEAL